MTKEEKAENVALLASVVMGWEEPKDFKMFPPSTSAWRQDKQTYWNPYASIADAMEMLDKLDGWNGWLAKKLSPTEFYVEVYKLPPLIWKEGRGPTIQDAICAAFLEWARAQEEKK